jgi:hypothetical protein
MLPVQLAKPSEKAGHTAVMNDIRQDKYRYDFRSPRRGTHFVAKARLSFDWMMATAS